jgi:Bacterial regulatory proteins, tetR family
MAQLDRQETTLHEVTGTRTSLGETPSSGQHFTGEDQRHLAGNAPTRKAPKPAKLSVRRKDQMLGGFLSSAVTCHVARRQLALRLRARLVAVELALAGERRFTLPEVAERAGTSTRTLNVHFGVKDALFAFPPPELVPALFECWLTAGDAVGLGKNLAVAFQALDRNPTARSLILGLAKLHSDQPKLSLADGYFNAALRSHLIQQHPLSASCLGWTGYITDALRDSFRDWALYTPKNSMESIVPNLVDRLHPIAFL